MSVLLGLFTETRPSIVPTDVERALNVSPATAYRYLSDLCDTGLISRVSGRYAPGPKVLELEYLVRRFDPTLGVQRDALHLLSERTCCHVLLSRLYGQNLVNIFYAKGEGLPDLNYVTGRKLPLFRGSQAKVVLAFMDRRKLKRIYELHVDEPFRDAISPTWTGFSQAMSRIKRAGHYTSRNELDPNTTGIAVPVFGEDGDVAGSLVLAFASSDPPLIGETRLVEIAEFNARTISRRCLASDASQEGDLKEPKETQDEPLRQLAQI